jgi:hypothetical protein
MSDNQGSKSPYSHIKTFKNIFSRIIALETGGGGSMVYPTHATIWHDESTVITGNAFVTGASSHDTSQNYGAYKYQNTPANGDKFETIPFLLAAGTYTVTILGVTNNNYGKVDWRLNGTLIGGAATGQDWYSASLTYNVEQSFSMAVAVDGVYTLSGTINGTNGSSISPFYRAVLTKFWIK